MGGARVGLVLREQSVEVVEARRGLFGIRMAKTVSVPIQRRDGTDETAVVEAIRTALSTARVKATRLGVSVPVQDVLLRSFTMPLLPKAEWKTAVQFEVRKYIPFKTEELVWNFHATEQPSTKQLVVAFVGIRAETFAKIQGWLAKAGVKPAFIEAQAVSLARVVAQPRHAPAEQCLGLVDVDVDAGMAHIVIAKRHVPYFARDVHLNLDLSASARGEGATPGAGQTAVDHRAEVLLSELRLSLDFFTRENPQAVIPQLVMFGDQMTISAWVGWLTQELHCPVAIGMLPLERHGGQPISLRFASAMGLVLRELRPTIVRLDFPERRGTSREVVAGKATKRSFITTVISKVDLTRVKALARTLAMQIALALVVIIGWTSARHQAVLSARHDLEAKLKAAPEVGWGLRAHSKEALLALQQQVEQRLTVLRTIQEQGVSVTEKLDALAKELPQGIWLEGLTYQHRLDRTGQSQQVLTLRGACFLPGQGGELEVIGRFADQLKEDQKFFRGFQMSQLGEIGTGQATRQQVSYRTFKLNYHSERKPL